MLARPRPRHSRGAANVTKAGGERSIEDVAIFEERQGEWRQRARNVPREVALQPEHVVPGAKLPADSPVRAYRTKPIGFMEADTGLVGQRDSRKCVAVAEQVQHRKERR